jgi:hypothetical protein
MKSEKNYLKMLSSHTPGETEKNHKYIRGENQTGNIQNASLDPRTNLLCSASPSFQNFNIYRNYFVWVLNGLRQAKMCLSPARFPFWIDAFRDSVEPWWLWVEFRDWIFTLFWSPTPIYNFSSTFYPQSCWYILHVSSTSLVANPKSGPDYSVFIMKYIYIIIIIIIIMSVIPLGT